jgi:hypothetical protein
LLPCHLHAAEHTVTLRRYVPVTAYEGFSRAVQNDPSRRYTYMAVEDTSIRQADPDLNFGGSDTLEIHEADDRILIQFEHLFRAVTVGADVKNVTLTLVPTKPIERDATVRIYRVTAPWRDGGSDGEKQVQGATFNARFADIAPFNRAWTTPGGNDDRAAQPSFSAKIGDCWNAEKKVFEFSGPGLVADVERWLERHYRNYGWIIEIDGLTSPIAFYASDVFETERRPALTIAFDSKPVEKPALPDLNVTFIERTPRYYRYNDNGKYSYTRKEFRGDMPGIMVAPDYMDDQKWPANGDLVMFIAHIKNASDTPYEGPLTYRWKINDEVVLERDAKSVNWTNGKPAVIRLEPWEEVTTFLEWDWEVDRRDPRKVVIEFEVDPEDQVEEITENNNQLLKYAAAKTLKYWVERSVYEYVKDYVSSWGSYSFEDYLQWHCTVWNETYFCKSRFDDFAPDGGVLRVTLDDFEIVPDGYLAGGIHRPEDRLDPRFDGEWGTTWAGIRSDEGENLQGYYDFLQRHRVTLEGSLLHEWSHQVWGAYDIYWSNIEPSEPERPIGKCKLKDESGYYITRGDFYLFPGLMGGDDTRPNPRYAANTGLYSANSIGGANANAPFRNGFYGEWQYDLPKTCYVKLMSQDGEPLEGAKVSIWQQTWKGIINENQVAADLEVGPDGVLQLPNQPSGEPIDITTVTGHTLRKENPWGRLDVVGQNITLLLQVNYHGQRDYQFVRATTFNRPYWNGHTDEWTHPLHCRISPSAEIDLTTNVAAGAAAHASRESENADQAVDGKADTTYSAGGTQAGDYIEITLPRTQRVGVMQIVQDRNHGDLFDRFVIKTKASPDGEWEAFAEQGPLSFSRAMTFDKDVNPQRPQEKWVTFAGSPRATRVIRIEALEDTGGVHLSELRVFAERD